ncbi:hypothetical protein AB4Y63_18185 [Leifsonia sp. YAF41]|uniref:hypothetical protein n=1 Tax=Leifsonia sp. YAF41 TaxID=3233086 RepID=UPI003F94F5EC
MRAPATLGLFGAGLAAIFAGSLLVGQALAPVIGPDAESSVGSNVGPSIAPTIQPEHNDDVNH